MICGASPTRGGAARYCVQRKGLCVRRWTKFIERFTEKFAEQYTERCTGQFAEQLRNYQFAKSNSLPKFITNNLPSTFPSSLPNGTTNGLPDSVPGTKHRMPTG